MNSTLRRAIVSVGAGTLILASCSSDGAVTGTEQPDSGPAVVDPVETAAEPDAELDSAVDPDSGTALDEPPATESQAASEPEAEPESDSDGQRGSELVPEDAFPRTVESVVGETLIEVAPERIVLGERRHILSTLLALGVVPEQFFAYQLPYLDTRLLDWEQEALDELGATPEIIDLDLSVLIPPIEPVVAADPDLLIAAGTLELPITDQIAEVAPYVQVPGAADWRANVRIVSDAIGRPDDGDALVAEMEAKIVETAAFANDVGASGRTFAVVSFADTQTFVCRDPEFGPTSLQLQLGLVQPAEVARLGEAVCEPVSDELIVELLGAVDFLHVFQFGGESVDEQLDDPIRRLIPALADGRFCYVPDSELGAAFDELNPLSIDLVLDELRRCAEVAAAGT